MSTSSQAITVGLGLGLVNTFVENYGDLVECFQSCDSWVLKTEKLLSYAGFILGVSKPCEVVFRVIKRLLNDIALKLFGATFDEHPHFERTLQVGLSFFGQKKLTDIWDLVRENSLCMLMNNCSDDFFSELNDLKISWCNVEGDEEDWYSGRKLSICEQLFNDSPLILLSVVVMTLFFVANYHNFDEGPPPGGNMKPQVSTSPRMEPAQKNDSLPKEPPFTPPSSPPPSNNRIETDPKPLLDSTPNKDEQPPAQPKPNNSSPLRAGPKPPEATPKVDPPSPKSSPAHPPIPDHPTPKSSPAHPSIPNTPNRDTPSHTKDGNTTTGTVNPHIPDRCNCGGSTQNLNVICPSCKKKETHTLPRPMPMYCCKSCCENPGNQSKPLDDKQNRTPDLNSLDEEIKSAISKHTEELLNRISKCLCPKCKQHFDEQRKLCQPPPIKLARLTCPDCGQPYPKPD